MELTIENTEEQIYHPYDFIEKIRLKMNGNSNIAEQLRKVLEKSKNCNPIDLFYTSCELNLLEVAFYISKITPEKFDNTFLEKCLTFVIYEYDNLEMVKLLWKLKSPDYRFNCIDGILGNLYSIDGLKLIKWIFKEEPHLFNKEFCKLLIEDAFIFENLDAIKFILKNFPDCKLTMETLNQYPIRNKKIKRFVSTLNII
jgi:hypothetical protein